MKFKVIKSSKGIKNGEIEEIDPTEVFEMVSAGLQNCKVESEMCSYRPGIWMIQTTLSSRFKEWGENPEYYSVTRNSAEYSESDILFPFQLRWLVRDHIMALASELGKARYVNYKEL